MSKVTHKTVVDNHIDSLIEGASITMSTLIRVEKQLQDLKDDNSSIKRSMTSLTKENLLFLHQLYQIFDEISYKKDYLIKKETFTNIMQKLETITNNLLKTKTMLEGQPWI